MRHTKIVMTLVLGLALIAGACAADGTESDESQPPANESATVQQQPETTQPSTTTTTLLETGASEPGSASTTIETVVYLNDGEEELLVDVYVPGGEGPFPVAILVHGMPSSKDDPNQTTTAAAAAEAGMLTFVPNWNPTVGSMSSAWMRSEIAKLACALAFAEQEAASYGGDPARVVTSGFSAGAPGATWLAMGHVMQLPEGCVATEIPYRPVGAVLGDSEYFLHTGLFDGGFNTDLAGMQELVAEIVDSSHWPADLSAVFRIWYAENSRGARLFEDAWAGDDWLAQRDPDGSIREDLDELGLLDDGIISYLDASELLAHRLQRAGQDAAAYMHPGGHTMLDKTDELVAYLLDAASPSATVAATVPEATAPVFDFATDDLCEWVTAEDITRIVSEAYTTYGASPIPTDFEQADDSSDSGCWWASPSGADAGGNGSTVGLIQADPVGSYEKTGPISELFQPHDGLSAGVQVLRPWPVPVGDHDDYVPGVQVRLLVDGHQESLEFWHMVPPGYEGDAVPILTIADEILRLMGWTTVERS